LRPHILRPHYTFFFFTFLLRLNIYLHGIKWMFSIIQRKPKKNFNYNTCIIPNLSNGYIHLYWIGPQTFASNGKCIGKCLNELKDDGRNIISSLHIVWTIFISNISMCYVFNLLEHISLKKWVIFMSVSHILFDNKSR
jgi:hypothetical protein